MKHRFLFFFVFLCPFTVFCQTKNIEINLEITYQEIDHFAASDAWSGNFVGMYWSVDEKEKIARWLFSQKTDVSGNPEGIGLSLDMDEYLYEKEQEQELNTMESKLQKAKQDYESCKA
ncbi:MAG: hypothetical protein LBS79_02865 [Tannerella sp.]|jgi:hypothetical protein|nr:hypothetical protein [Tannerella sp.]